MDMTMNMDGIISDHEWHLLILKAKGLLKLVKMGDVEMETHT